MKYSNQYQFVFSFILDERKGKIMENHFIFGNTKRIKGVFDVTSVRMLFILLLITFIFGVCLGSKAYGAHCIYSLKIDVLDDEGKIEKTNTFFISEKINEAQIENSIYKHLKKKNAKLVDADFSSNVKMTVEPAENTEGASVLSKDKVAKHILAGNAADVVTVEKETRLVKTLKYKTITRKTSKLRKTVTKVKRRGKRGKVTSSKYITRENGVAVKVSKAYKKKVVPVNKIIHKGTGRVTVHSGKVYDGTKNKDIVKFAKKFLGNPYRYGGTSLTKGADCSGFVYAVYRHHGLDLPRVGQTGVGKRVSVRKLKPGDVVAYSGHMAIYIGKGKVIHALNRSRGICISSLHLVGRPLRASRIVRN